MKDFPALPAQWPSYDLGSPETRRVIVREEAHLAGKVFRAISMLIVAIGLGIVYFSYSAKIARLVSEGVALQATVESKGRYKRSKSKEYYPSIYYTYYFGGFPYSFNEEIDEELYAKTQVGKTVRVTVHPEDPYYHWLGTVDEADVREARVRGSIIVLAVALPFALIAMGLRSSNRKDARVLGTWNVTSAQVTEISSERGPKGGEFFYVHYRVPLPEGGFLLGKDSISENMAKWIERDDFFPVLVPPGPLHSKSNARPLFHFEHMEVEGEDLSRRNPSPNPTPRSQ